MLTSRVPTLFIWDGDKMIQCGTLESTGDWTWILLMISEATRSINNLQFQVVSEPTRLPKGIPSVPKACSFVYLEYNLETERPALVQTDLNREQAINMLMLILEVLISEPCQVDKSPFFQ